MLRTPVSLIIHRWAIICQACGNAMYKVLGVKHKFLNNMKDVYIVWLTITNDMEPSHYSSSKERSIQGVYTSNELALAKIDDLYQQYAEASIEHPEYDFIHQECTIETYQLNP